MSEGVLIEGGAGDVPACTGFNSPQSVGVIPLAGPPPEEDAWDSCSCTHADGDDRSVRRVAALIRQHELEERAMRLGGVCGCGAPPCAGNTMVRELPAASLHHALPALPALPVLPPQTGAGADTHADARASSSAELPSGCCGMDAAQETEGHHGARPRDLADYKTAVMDWLAASSALPAQRYFVEFLPHKSVIFVVSECGYGEQLQLVPGGAPVRPHAFGQRYASEHPAAPAFLPHRAVQPARPPIPGLRCLSVLVCAARVTCMRSHPGSFRSWVAVGFEGGVVAAFPAGASEPELVVALGKHAAGVRVTALELVCLLDRTLLFAGLSSGDVWCVDVCCGTPCLLTVAAGEVCGLFFVSRDGSALDKSAERQPAERFFGAACLAVTSATTLSCYSLQLRHGRHAPRPEVSLSRIQAQSPPAREDVCGLAGCLISHSDAASLGPEDGNEAGQGSADGKGNGRVTVDKNEKGAAGKRGKAKEDKSKEGNAHEAKNGGGDNDSNNADADDSSNNNSNYNNNNNNDDNNNNSDNNNDNNSDAATVCASLVSSVGARDLLGRLAGTRARRLEFTASYRVVDPRDGDAYVALVDAQANVVMARVAGVLGGTRSPADAARDFTLVDIAARARAELRLSPVAPVTPVTMDIAGDGRGFVELAVSAAPCVLGFSLFDTRAPTPSAPAPTLTPTPIPAPAPAAPGSPGSPHLLSALKLSPAPTPTPMKTFSARFNILEFKTLETVYMLPDSAESVGHDGEELCPRGCTPPCSITQHLVPTSSQYSDIVRQNKQ